jgi:hypothetical protein
MARILSRWFMGLLLVVHAGLILWAGVGLAEWFLSTVPWQRVANPLFPPAMLLAQWLSILGTSGIFLAGYLLRWPGTPTAVTLGYAVMASICAVQTFGYLVHASRFVDMGLEYATYVVIALYLFRSALARERFAGGAKLLFGAQH